ncbi:MAG TPA: hypothetical protein DCK87_02640 [Desulfotomaculum sp.]|nr:hypothetical protein [Desulfotomaculum sp.]
MNCKRLPEKRNCRPGRPGFRQTGAMKKTGITTASTRTGNFAALQNRTVKLNVRPVERYLGLPVNSAQSPKFGSWELKIVPLKRLASGNIVVKETMAITMIDPYNVANTPFEQSHLLAKLKKAVVCARLFESKNEDRSIAICTHLHRWYCLKIRYC